MTEHRDGHNRIVTRFEGVSGQKRLILEAHQPGPFGVDTTVSYVTLSADAALAIAEEIQTQMKESR
ncbi:hypothetical protein P3H15_32760 [Rhodococcus sp. T2V]|uniref:hypothetical protein n=1 Tax=Rhodococcus sp. T2V TaxID=3034164 RepID=UPI0023E2CF0A|nr:hypothetical protein [Rhodococcus sp. T2V]MDF3309792.1 hypothetical protein [Rhodococcus sp. T2V]